MESEEDIELSKVNLVDSSNALLDVVESSPKGRFVKFKEQLGRGAFKTVYRALDNSTGCEVAWNAIKTTNLTHKDKNRMIEEISLIQKLKHPNIIHLIGAWYSQDNEELVFITEIMSGGSLKKYLKRAKAPYLKVIVHWCREVLKGLQYLHSQKPFPVIHRDLKTDNLFVCSSTGTVRIGDLGLSTVLNSSHKQSVLGTPQYMAPEVFDCKYTTAIDIYSFGMCLIEMVTHRSPYSNSKNPGDIYRKIIKKEVPPEISTIKDQEVKDLVLACLSSQESRPTAEQLLRHRLFSEGLKDPKLFRPVEVSEPQKINPSYFGQSQSSFVKISLNLGIQNQQSIQRNRIEFDYNKENDSPGSVAHEIAQEFKLSQAQTEVIADKITDKLMSTESPPSSETSESTYLLKLIKSKLPNTGNLENKSIEEVVRECQETLGLEPTGIVDQRLLDSLLEAPGDP